MDNILSPEKLTHTWLEDTLALLFGTLMISFGIILGYLHSRVGIHPF